MGTAEGEKREGVMGEVVRREEGWSAALQGEEKVVEFDVWDEVEWERNQRKILLELGLAVEWNKDNREERRGNEYEYTPSFMDLKLLPADQLHKKCATQFPDMHKD